MSIATDFQVFLKLLSRSRRTILTFVLAAIGLGILLALVLPPRYEGRVVTMPAEREEYSGALGALAGQFAGLADLAGLNLDSNSDLEMSIAVLTSRRFTDEFLRRENVLPHLFPELWDEARGTWRPEQELSLWRKLRRGISSLLARITGDKGVQSGMQAEPGPSSWEAFRRFDKLRSVVRDKRTGIVTVAVRWRDPELAARWANRLVELANERIRSDAVHESRQRQLYLEKQIENTPVVGLREALFRISEAEQRRAMLANVRKEYAFRIIDPAVVAEQRVSPKRTLLVISMAFVGLFVGLAFVVLREILRGRQGASA